MSKASRWLAKARRAGLPQTSEAALDAWWVGLTHPTYAPKERPTRLIITTRGVVLLTDGVVLAANYSDLVGLGLPGAVPQGARPGVRVGDDIYRLQWPQHEDQRIRTGINNGQAIAGLARGSSS